jgi:hypothetical protein
MNNQPDQSYADPATPTDSDTEIVCPAAGTDLASSKPPKPAEPAQPAKPKQPQPNIPQAPHEEPSKQKPDQKDKEQKDKGDKNTDGDDAPKPSRPGRPKGQDQDQLPVQTENSVCASETMRAGQHVVTDRDGKTYEGNTGVSGETAEGERKSC